MFTIEERKPKMTKMKTHLLLIAVVSGLLESAVCNAADQAAEIKVVQTVTNQPSGNAQLPREFNYGRSFVISVNLNIPSSETVKQNLISTLAKEKLVDKVVFGFFSSEKQPAFVEVEFGSRVPLDIAQSVIKALAETPNIKVTVALETADGSLGDTQRVYIGSLTQRPKKPVTQEKLRSLLNTQLSLKQFHDEVLKNE